VIILVVHDVFGAHGYLAMRPHPAGNQKGKRRSGRLNKENLQLGQEVKELKTRSAQN